jgi:ribose 1,5-bisphosphate isomerase
MTFVLPAVADARLRALAADRVSGAREIAGRFLNVVAELVRGPVPAEEALVAAAAAVVPRQPTLAALLSGTDRLFRAAERGGAEAVRAEVERQLGVGVRDLARIAEAACEILAPLESVALVSWSTTVAAVLARGGRGVMRVVVAESRPGAEGRRAAQHAAELGKQVEFYADAAFPAAAAGCDALLLGGDALTPHGLVNKTGSRAAAREVRAAGRPVYACLEDLKIAGYGLAERLRLLPEPPSQLWDAPPPGVTVKNPWFEIVPVALLTSLVTSAGVESPASAIERAGPETPSPLWARIPYPVDGVPL